MTSTCGRGSTGGGAADLVQAAKASAAAHHAIGLEFMATGCENSEVGRSPRPAIRDARQSKPNGRCNQEKYARIP
jgi:hypothetical protein